MNPAPARRLAVLALAGAVAVAACGGGGDDRPERAAPEDGVRAAVRTYLGALAARDWLRACELMTPSARRDVADASGRTCARALASGAALGGAELESARREVAGADVSIRGGTATLGPIGGAQQALRLRRADGRWLVTS
jgi:hypothetical protein